MWRTRSSDRQRCETRRGATNSSRAALRMSISSIRFACAEWRRGERIVMTRNEHYWGRKPAWNTVVLKSIPNDSARVAALLAHDVDAINGVPPSAIPDLKNRSD